MSEQEVIDLMKSSQTAEKWENGLLYYKTTPQDNWKLKTMTLADLYEGVTGNHITLGLALDIAHSLGVDTQKE